MSGRCGDAVDSRSFQKAPVSASAVNKNRNERSESGLSILEKQHPIKSHNEIARRAGRSQIAVIGNKCGCNLVWCSACFKKRGAKTITSKLRKMNWRSVRQIVLTVNPEFFEDGKAAHRYVTEKRLIAALVRDLERTKGVKVRDWQWVLEWHRNGFPHWHLFIDVTTEGQRGMIGGNTIRHYWNWGGVKEMPIKTEKHWWRITGYFEKHGYFDKAKAHQAALPQWAMDDNKSIRRTGGRVVKKADDTLPDDLHTEDSAEGILESLDLPESEQEMYLVCQLGAYFDAQSRAYFRESYRERLAKCGSQTAIRLPHDHYFGRIDFPYKKFREMPGEYVDGVGYVVNMEHSEFLHFMRNYRLQEIQRPITYLEGENQ